MIFSGKFVVDFSGSDRLFATQLSRFLITVWLFLGFGESEQEEI